MQPPETIGALAIQVLSPLIASPGGRFEIQPAHFVERHGALIIVALGESVAAVGISASREDMTGSVVAAAVLGLALTACLWWAYFGTGDDDRAERAFTAAAPAQRPGLALSAYFFAHIPMLLGIVAMAAGVQKEQPPGARGRQVAECGTFSLVLTTAMLLVFRMRGLL